MVYSGAWGKLIREKNQKAWHCPFNGMALLLLINFQILILSLCVNKQFPILFQWLQKLKTYTQLLK